MSSPTDPSAASPSPPPARTQHGAETIESQAILRGRNSVTISHKGFVYRLQETRAGKLILTK